MVTFILGYFLISAAWLIAGIIPFVIIEDSLGTRKRDNYRWAIIQGVCIGPGLLVALPVLWAAQRIAAWADAG